MKELFKKLWTIVKPLIKGWTNEGMAKHLEAQGYTVKRPE